MVGSRSQGCVVHRITTSCGGGSSSVFSRALAAPSWIWCASSMMVTRYREATGAYRTLSSHSRISSMRRALDAASTSTTSSQSSRPMRRHESHSPQGVGVGAGKAWQLRHRARIRAVVVLPVPRGPENRNPWAMVPRSRALPSVRATCSWPTRSSNRRGRYLL